MRRIALVVVAACGAKQPTDWREHDLGATHATASTAAAKDIVIDPTRIDDYDEATITAALDRAGERAPAAALALRAARLAHHRGDDTLARSLVARATTAADESAHHAELTALATELAEPPVDPSVVAVLLPLSGRYAAIGLELRAAIELAPASGTRWLFVDTRGEPDGAIAAVDTAVAKGAVAILGPVGERETMAAARRASLRAIPIGLLAPEDGADASAGVFRFTWSVGDEARAVAKLAIDQSFPTVAVLAPRDDLGSEAADAFVAEATRLGVPVTRRGTYDPTGGDVEPDVREFLDLVPARNPRLTEHLARHGKKGWSTFSPDVPFTMLYIPDRYDRAAIVAAFLPYYNVELRTIDFPDPAMLQRKHGGHMPQIVQLVGGGGWHHPSLPIRGGSAVQGALIVDVFGGDSVGGIEETFAAGLQAKTSRSPSAATAQAFDAATIMAAARAQAAGDRQAMTRALAHAKLADGACGPAEMGPDGELARAATILEVSGDELVPAP
jgi:ABC-type branched-subunit amino acid transport system substrate-binding protein